MNLPRISPASTAAKILRRSLAAVLVFSLLFGLFGYLAAPPIAKFVLTRVLSEKLHRETTIQGIVFHPYALSLYVRGFALKERDGSATVAAFDELYLNLEAISALRGNFVVKEIKLTAPYVKLVRTPDRRYNFSDLVEEFLSQPDSETKTRFSLNNIQLLGGKIDFDDRPMGKRHQVSDIHLAIPFVSNLPSHSDIYVQPSFRAHVNGRDFALSGKTRPFADKHEATLALDVDDLDLPMYLDYLPVALPFKVPAGLLDAKLTARFTQPHGKTPTLKISGGIDLKQVEIGEASGAPLFKLAALNVRIGSSDIFGSAPTAAGSFEIAGLTVNNYAPASIPLEIGGGDLEASSRFSFALAEGKPRVSLDGLAASLKNLSLRQLGEKQPFFTLAAAEIRDGRLDWNQRRLEIGEFITQDGKLTVKRQRDGTFDLAKLAPAQSPAEDSSAPWNISLNKLAVSDYTIRFEDKLPQPAVTLIGAPIAITAENLSTAKDSKPTLGLRANLDKNGVIAIAGTMRLAPLRANLELDVRGIDLVPLQPYFGKYLNASVTHGTLSTQGHLDIALPVSGDAPLEAAFSGDANLTNFQAIDKANDADLLKWKSLYLGGIRSRFTPLDLAIGEIALSDFYSRLIVNADGKLNLQELLRSTPGKTPAAPPAAPATVKIGKLTLQGGNVNFSDRFIKPNYGANLTDIGGRVAGLSSEPGSTAEVDLRGRLDGAAPLEIAGRINPLGKDLYLDLKASVKGVELTPFTPYSGKYAGYAIDKGKLSLDVRYRIENRKLEAENQLFLDQLTFGERIESVDATKLPVQLALALLKNRNGEIDLHLPISGSLDDPQFSMGGLIGKILVNLLTKAVTAPFALLGSLFGGGEELSYLEFAPGRHAVDAAREATLRTLAKALHERPALELDITGRIAPTLDIEGLKHAMLDNKVKAQKLNDLLKQDIEVGTIEDIVVAAAEYPALLKRAYQQETFPKPRTMLGWAKDLPVTEMEKLMLAHATVSDDDLRTLAILRAMAARDWLLRVGQVAPERIFLVAPKPASDEGKAQPSRVDFSLRQ